MIENLKFLPAPIVDALSKLRQEKIYELRLRADKPVSVCYGGKFYPLSKLCGASEDLILSPQQISGIVVRAAEYSVYAINNQIGAGYMAIKGGIRMGIAGEAVYESDKVKTQRNYNSLVIRIPHQIKGCATRAYDAFFAGKSGEDKTAYDVAGKAAYDGGGSFGNNLLVISPPGGGKTTFLRDLCRLISDNGSNVLLVDERGELASCNNGHAGLDVGVNTDIICGALKEYAFSCGIRSMRPDYIITDELTGSEIAAVENGINSGVCVIASVHARDIEELKNRAGFRGAIENRLFAGYVVLSAECPGRYECMLDKNLRRLP